MKLPKRGLLVDDKGQATWAWEHNDPDTDFDALPPFVSTLDGEDTQSVATPGSIVIDLEDVGLKPGDMHLIHNTLQMTRVRKRRDGSWRITQVIPGDMPDDPSMEIDHPLIDVLNVRRERRGQPPLKKGR